MCSSPSPAKLAATPIPQEQPKPLVSPEMQADTTAGIRTANSKRKLRIDASTPATGSTASGLGIPK